MSTDQLEQQRAMARHAALDETAKLAQNIEWDNSVHSVHVERTPNQTYFLITFSRTSIPPGFFDDYGLNFNSVRLVRPKSLISLLFGRMWPVGVAVPKEGDE